MPQTVLRKENHLYAAIFDSQTFHISILDVEKMSQ